MHSTRIGTSARHLGIAPYNYGPPHTVEAQEELQPRRRLHWLARLGIMLTLVLLGWLLLSEAAVWTQHALDTWHYGYPVPIRPMRWLATAIRSLTQVTLSRLTWMGTWR